MNYDPDELEKALEACADTAQKYKACVHQRLLFEHRSEDLLAALKMRFREEFPEASELELGNRAKGSKEWQEFRKVQMELLQEAGKREVEYNEADRVWKTKQSQLSFTKEHLRQLGGT